MASKMRDEFTIKLSVCRVTEILKVDADPSRMEQAQLKIVFAAGPQQTEVSVQASADVDQSLCGVGPGESRAARRIYATWIRNVA
jgi:hypothetical protein